MKTACCSPSLVAAVAAHRRARRRRTGIEHTPVNCISAGELPLLQVQTSQARASCAATSAASTPPTGARSRERTRARSRAWSCRSSRTATRSSTSSCSSTAARRGTQPAHLPRARQRRRARRPFARHVIRLSMNCGEDAQAHPVVARRRHATSSDELVRGNPPVTSPDEPVAPTT